ncbi:MAG: hypothetical protein ACOC85_02995 [Thermoplasmatota archaeon]
MKGIHEMFDDVDIDSRIHEPTSEDNGELNKIVSDSGYYMPVKNK